MRKHLLPLSLLLLLAGCAVFQKRISEILHPEQPVSKSISFAVNTDENYSSIVYNDAFAQLRITVTKIRGNQRAMVWDTIYNPQKLQDYSFLKNAMSKEIIINNVLESKENLEVLYTLTYYSKGNVLQLYNDTILTPGIRQKKLCINV
jgi:hypothetical protein